MTENQKPPPVRQSFSDPEKWDLLPPAHTPLETSLPLSMYREIGRVAFKFSLLEHQLRQAAYLVAGVDRRIGRVAFRDPRAEDMVEMINDLIDSKEMKIEHIAKGFLTKLRKAKTDRDLLCHGLWARNPNTQEIQLITVRGTADTPREGHIKRKLEPISVTVTVEMIRELTRSIETLSTILNDFLVAVLAELGTSQEILRPPLDLTSRNRGQKSDK
jgi:hypothetical protein